MHAVFKRPKKDDYTGLLTDKFEEEDVYQASKTYVAMQPEEMESDMPQVFQTIHAGYQEFQREGSGHIKSTEGFVVLQLPYGVSCQSV